MVMKMLIEIDDPTLSDADFALIRQSVPGEKSQIGLTLVKNIRGERYYRYRNNSGFVPFLDNREDRPYLYRKPVDARRICKESGACLAIWIHPDLRWREYPTLSEIILRAAAASNNFQI
jgi:hypothetical protein